MKKENSRREFLKKSAMATLAGAALRLTGNATLANGMYSTAGDVFILPALPYPVDALEPHIDAQTMQIHHGKHHQAYVTNLNRALNEANIDKTDLERILEGISKYSVAIRNNGGGHYNHSLFWKLMSPTGGGEPTGAVADAINSTFGNFSTFREKFNAVATSRFGSGWAWLVIRDNKIEIGSTPNQDNPLMDVSDLKGKPLLALDVWEHAYYLKYQNKRVEYIQAWWNVVNWEEVSRLMLAKK